MPFEIIPSIDLRGGRVVRLKQGDYARQLDYDVDPLATARAFVDAGAGRVHVVDLDGALDGRPAQIELVSTLIRATPELEFQVGGGVRTTDDVRALMSAGASRVVVGTKALEDWHWFEGLTAQATFAHRIILALDARDGVVATRGWTASSGKRATDIAAWVSGWPLAAILYTDIARDGMLGGPSFEQTESVARAGRVPVIASGGVGSLDHIRRLRELPISGAIVGRSLYEGAFSLSQAIAVARG